MPAAPVPTRRRLAAVPRLRRLAVEAPTVVRAPGDEAIREVDSAAREVESRDRLYRRALAYADVLSAGLALIVCTSVLGNDDLRTTTLLALPLIVAAGKVQGLYDRDELLIRKTTIDEAPKLFHLATLYTLLLWVLDGVLIDGELGSKQGVVLWGALFAFSLCGRIVARSAVSRVAPVERLMLICDAVAY